MPYLVPSHTFLVEFAADFSDYNTVQRPSFLLQYCGAVKRPSAMRDVRSGERPRFFTDFDCPFRWNVKRMLLDVYDRAHGLISAFCVHFKTTPLYQVV